MKAYRSNGNLVIEISEDALCDGTLQIPGNECKVTDRETYLNHVADNIIDIGETGDFNSCSSLTRLIDECVQHALDCGAGVEVEDWHNAELHRPCEAGSVARSGSPAKRESSPPQHEVPQSPAKRGIATLSHEEGEK